MKPVCTKEPVLRQDEGVDGVWIEPVLEEVGCRRCASQVTAAAGAAADFGGEAPGSGGVSEGSGTRGAASPSNSIGQYDGVGFGEGVDPEVGGSRGGEEGASLVSGSERGGGEHCVSALGFGTENRIGALETDLAGDFGDRGRGIGSIRAKEDEGRCENQDRHDNQEFDEGVSRAVFHVLEPVGGRS